MKGFGIGSDYMARSVQKKDNIIDTSSIIRALHEPIPEKEFKALIKSLESFCLPEDLIKEFEQKFKHSPRRVVEYERLQLIYKN